MEEGAPKLTTARRLKASCTCLRGAPPTVPYEGIACSACTIVSGDASAGKKSFIFTSKKENKKTSQEPRGKRMSELAHGWEAVASGDEFYYWNRYGVPNIHFFFGLYLILSPVAPLQNNNVTTAAYMVR